MPLFTSSFPFQLNMLALPLRFTGFFNQATQKSTESTILTPPDNPQPGIPAQPAAAPASPPRVVPNNQPAIALENRQPGLSRQPPPVNQGVPSQIAVSGRWRIRIGDEFHSINVDKHEYFKLLIRFELLRGIPADQITHAPIPHLHAILAASERGPRVFFDALPQAVSVYADVVATLEKFPMAPIMGQLTWAKVHREIVPNTKRAGQHLREHHPRVDRLANTAKDGAFRLIVCMLRNSPAADETKNRQLAFQLVAELFKRKKVFSLHVRDIVVDVFIMKYGLGLKQMRRLVKHGASKDLLAMEFDTPAIQAAKAERKARARNLYSPE